MQNIEIKWLTWKIFRNKELRDFLGCSYFSSTFEVKVNRVTGKAPSPLLG
jgi:hypothetical protein